MGHDRRRFRLILAAGAYCLAAAMFVAPAFAGLDSWTAIGPDGARVFALAVDARNASIAYAGLPGGVILSTNDGGANWATTNVGRSAPVYTIVVDPIRSATADAGTDAGVFRTTDGGRTWVKVTDAAESRVVMPTLSQLPINAFAYDPVSPSTRYAGVNGGIDGNTYGIFKSTDGGVHWAQIYRTLNRSWGLAWVVALAVHPRSPSNLYALFSSFELLTSADGGVTWSDVLPLGIHAQSFAIDPVDPSTLYVGSDDGTLYRTTDAGGHWTSASDRLPVGSVYALAVSSSDPTIVYAGGRTGIARSLDHGQTWSKQILGVRGVGSTVMATDPGTPSTVYLADEGDIAKTTDGGARWTAVTPGLKGQPFRFLAIDPSTPSTLYAGGQDSPSPAFYKSTDGGAHWVARPGDSTLYDIVSFAIAPSRSSTLYAVTADGVVVKSIDGGATWASLISNLHISSALNVKVDPKSADTVYVAADCGSPCFYKSTDGGGHWRNIPVSFQENTTVSVLAYDPFTSSTMYVATTVSWDWSPAAIFKSIDAGETWSALGAIAPSTYANVAALAFDPVHRSRIFAATDAGVQISSDGGATWSQMSYPGLPSNAVTDVSIDATGSLLRATLDQGFFELQMANPLPIGAGFTGSWYNPAQSGHGFMLEVLPGIPMQLLASWFTFAPQGGHSWITAVGPINGGQAVLQAYQSVGSGGRFPPNFDAANVRQEGWGTLTFTFSDCNHGRVDWSPTAPGYGSGGMDLARLTLPAGLSCSDTGTR